VDLPIENGGSFHSYVNVYQAGYISDLLSRVIHQFLCGMIIGLSGTPKPTGWLSFLYWHYWEYRNTPCFDIYIYTYCIYIILLYIYYNCIYYNCIYIYIYVVVLSTYHLQFVWRHSEVDFLASSRCVHCPQEHKEKDPVRRSPGGINSADFDLKPWGKKQQLDTECWNGWNRVVCQRLPGYPQNNVSSIDSIPTLIEAFPALGAITGAAHFSGFHRFKFNNH